MHGGACISGEGGLLKAVVDVVIAEFLFGVPFVWQVLNLSRAILMGMMAAIAVKSSGQGTGERRSDLPAIAGRVSSRARYLAHQRETMSLPQLISSAPSGGTIG